MDQESMLEALILFSWFDSRLAACRVSGKAIMPIIKEPKSKVIYLP